MAYDSKQSYVKCRLQAQSMNDLQPHEDTARAVLWTVLEDKQAFGMRHRVKELYPFFRSRV